MFSQVGGKCLIQLDDTRLILSHRQSPHIFIITITQLLNYMNSIHMIDINKIRLTTLLTVFNRHGLITGSFYKGKNTKRLNRGLNLSLILS